MCSSRKCPYYPHRRDWKFLGVGGSQRPKDLSKCMKLDWNFQRGGGGLRENPFHGGGMDNFWNQIILILANISDISNNNGTATRTAKKQ